MDERDPVPEMDAASEIRLYKPVTSIWAYSCLFSLSHHSLGEKEGLCEQPGGEAHAVRNWNF